MKILLTGANGYIGKRLLPVLLESGHQIYCMVRDKARMIVPEYILEQITIVETDLLHPVNIQNVPKDIDVVYYLVHSMASTNKHFDKLEELVARNFVEYIDQTTAKQIIYLGGIYNDSNLSKHLASRLNVETILFTAQKPLTVLRAGIIVGSGSASFETIRDLVEKLPVMITPHWLNTKTQPIAIRNVIDYLKGALLNEKTFNKIFDIGGPEILTYKEMLLQFAEVRGYKRYVITLKFLPVTMSAYWLFVITSTSYYLAKNLVESLRNQIIVKHFGINGIIPTKLLDYKTAVNLAFDKIAQNMVISSWKDALASSQFDTDILKHVEVPIWGCYTDKRKQNFTADINDVLNNIWSIGGEKGWYSANSLWMMRGAIDKVFGGVGIERGRRSPTELYMGDALDFWRVLIADKCKRRLLLYAEMKAPGEAWLEFKIREKENIKTLYLTATFRPRGIAGRLYWYSMLPFHYFIFKSMVQRLTTENIN